jgi:rod shape-determining protein MreD
MALVQATFLPALGILQIIPDFALVFLLIWSSTHGTREGLFWAFALGLWIDFLTLDLLGTHGIALLAVALIGGATKDRLFRSGIILPMAAVFAATLAYNAIVQFLSVVSGDGLEAVGALRLSLMTSLLNMLLVPVAYVVLLLIERWMPRSVR